MSYIYVSKDVRIRGYFSKPKGCASKENFGNTFDLEVTLLYRYRRK